ncbi:MULTISPECIES: hypothetical protein [Janthinobacterium]|jgi:hypothetical protein|uniref:Uncharacterized protein n=1 Tax=Janthinobacterium lividum TaxID=29581 RepID=A0ABU0Y225_9BURK|nr:MULTISPECIES: hypothetical protein [Janthinobacterium]MDQ4629881.1 hypothetical protein [Janthinobacterium lividum]MDQ4678014.1 hypothetical protein [Janthinobacterium lividum]MDQ4688122.1 hypothetical protein [Janthinobacterium lividum]
MTGDERDMVIHKSRPLLSGRRSVIGLIGLGLMMPLAACGQGKKKMQKETALHVEVFSYIDRIIIDISFNGTGLGVMNRYGRTGTITDVYIPFGIQTLRWRLDGPEGTPRNGEVVTPKNQLVISPEQISPGTRYLGIHLYPDDTVEFTFADSIPEQTARGQKILANRKK